MENFWKMASIAIAMATTGVFGFFIGRLSAKKSKELNADDFKDDVEALLNEDFDIDADADTENASVKESSAPATEEQTAPETDEPVYETASDETVTAEDVKVEDIKADTGTEQKTEELRQETEELVQVLDGIKSVMDIVAETGVTESCVRKDIKAAGIESVQKIKDKNGRTVKGYLYEDVRKALMEAGHLGEQDSADIAEDTALIHAESVTEDSILSVMDIVAVTGVTESCVRKDIKTAGLESSQKIKDSKGRMVRGYRFGDAARILREANHYKHDAETR